MFTERRGSKENNFLMMIVRNKENENANYEMSGGVQ